MSRIIHSPAFRLIALTSALVIADGLWLYFSHFSELWLYANPGLILIGKLMSFEYPIASMLYSLQLWLFFTGSVLVSVAFLFSISVMMLHETGTIKSKKLFIWSTVFFWIVILGALLAAKPWQGFIE
jgi:hypothetical protein